MPTGQSADLKFEIGHVLFLDIVGYSKLLINEQSDQLETLKQIVRGAEQFRIAEAEGKLLRLPTGDGGALVFRNNPEAPVLCALEISKEFQKHPELRVRMGIHSGPVNEIKDLNEQANIAGAGINIAQRVMDCGDAGHILLSRRVAEDLEHYPRWRPHLHELGECEVKHGQKISIVNLYNDLVGNSEVPAKLRRAKKPSVPATDEPESAGQHEGFWVAVLPFIYRGDNSDLTALAEGLTEDVLTGLSRFSYLKVISRSSSSRFAGHSGDLRFAAKELGARYVMEGTLRQSGPKLRIAVQLVDTISGANLWAENYERAFSPDALFQLQDELVPRIVSTVADMNGVLPRSMSHVVRSRTPESLSPYEAVLRSFNYLERVTPQELDAARAGLESALQKEPAYADAWAMLAFLCAQEYAQGFNLQPDPLTSAAVAARRAIEAGPSNSLAYFSLAQVLFFQKEFDSFRNAAERAVALNPMDGNSIAFLGELLTYAGDSERGLALGERAKQLNPNHPGWYWYVDAYNAYRRRDYRAALGFLLKANLPGHWGMHAGLAACYGQLGEHDAAAKSLRDLLKLRPDFAATIAKDAEKWWEPGYGKHFIEGLRKAGLKIVDKEATRNSSAPSGKTPKQERFWVAVLPFKSSGGEEIESFAHGLSEDITTGLSRFGYLSVVTSALAARLEGQDEKAFAHQLGARYVLQGSIRKGGSGIRVTVHLVDVESSTQLWAETYNRDLEEFTIFEAQDDIAARIVATVADSYGVLIHSIREASRQKDEADFTPAEWQLQWFAYREQITPAALGALRSRCERAAKLKNPPLDLWACLAQVYLDEYSFGFPGVDAASLDRALAAVRRAVELDRTNQFAMVALAQTHFFRQDLAAFGPAAERAMALNPLNTDALGILGLEIVHTGEFERGTAIVRRAMELNPNHAGWMHFAPLWNHFHKGEYEQALACANRVDVPGHFWPFLVIASACGHLGRKTEAAAAVRDLLALDPDFAAHVRYNVRTWHFASGLMEPILAGLGKAGLRVPESDNLAGAPGLKPTPKAKTNQARPGTETEEKRADDGFWMAVLPFQHSGGNADLSVLAAGMTEEIVTGLSRFTYLHVIAIGSTTRYADRTVDVRTAGKELGARYVMEGSLRQAGPRLRVAVQLVDTISGAHLWAETYDRAFSTEDMFILQDDLVPRIVSTVADMHGVLPRSMSEVVRQKSADQMTPYEALLRSFGYNERFTPEDLAEVRICLERAVQQAPNNAECWAMLSLMYANEYGHWDNATSDSLDRSLQTARKAVEAAPLHSLPYYALAQALYFKKEFTAFRVAAERAISLNPMDGATAAFMGMLIAYSGDWERGCALSDKGCQLNPNHPGWYCYPAWHDSYRKKDYRKALDLAFQLNAPQNYYTHAVLAMCYAQLGRMDEARKALADMLALKPNYGSVARELHGRWIQPDLVEQLMDGLRKAGLEIAGAPVIPNPGKSVAVLPFVNMSPDKNDEYLSDGMTEELINALARVPGLRVPGRTSCFAFKGRTETDIFRKVGIQLHVDTVLEGSVRKAGEKLRITAQLINVADGYHLWSEDYDGDARDIFTFQSSVAQRVVEALQIKLGVEATRALAKKPTENPEAHRLYLLGRYDFGKYSEAGWTSSIRYYEQALKLDPNYALAYCGLADTYAYMGGVVMPSKEAVAKEKEFAERALQLEPQLAEAHLSLACALGGAFDWRNAQVEFDRAIELNPNLAWAYEIYAWFLCGAGRLDEAIAKDKTAIELDPLNSFFQAALAHFLYHGRRYDDAIVQIEKTLELDPASTLARHLLGCCLLWKGDTAGAIEEFQRSKIMVTGAWYQGLLGYAYAISGNRLKAEEILRQLEEMAKRQYVNATAFADIYLGLGEKEKALDWLEKSYEDQESACWYLKVDPIYDSVRNEPRFQALLKKVGLNQ